MAANSSQPCVGGDPGGLIQELQGYRTDRVRTALTCLLVAATGGLLLLPITWRPGVKLRLMCRPCPLQEADTVLVKDGYGQNFEEEVVKEHTNKAGITIPVHFIHKKIKYIWDASMLNFVRLSFLDSDTRWSDLREHATTGLSHDQSRQRLALYGANHMPIKPPSVAKLIYHEGVNPFYIMQIYSFVLWFASGYFEYALVLIAIGIISIGITVWQARRQTTALRKHSKSSMTVTTLRNSCPLVKDSRDLVPGEVIMLPGNCPFELDCDVVLLSGSCVVDESTLTGESHPLYKMPLSSDDSRLFDMDQNSQNIVFGGTKILQVKGRADVMAVVIRTGFDTLKGELVRSMLFPKPVDFQFYSDFTKYVICCLLLGVLAAAYSAYAWTRNQAPLPTVVLFSLDMITFVVPALLPISLSELYRHAQTCLQRDGIFCLCSKYILLCGRVDVFCFDKTGTLTESELGFAALVPCAPGSGFSEPLTELTSLDSDDARAAALAACHGLSLIDGEPRGDPLDRPLFEAVDWQLHEQQPAVDPDFPAAVATFVRPRHVVGARGAAAADLDVAIYKTFPFSAAERRATVLACSRFGAGLDVYVKGSPEGLVALCDPATVPDNFQDVLDWYTGQGLRVVGLAWKPLDPHLDLAQAERMAREELETDCQLLGLAVMHNALRASCYEPLQQLHRVDITPIMITGDNLLTAVNVARESGLVQRAQTILRVAAVLVPSSVNAAQHLRITYTIPETERSHTFLKAKLKSVHSDNYVFVIDGTSFDLIRTFDRSTLRVIVHRCRVYGRMTPQQKVQVIEALQDLGHQVGMCGDGCNDCGALRTAQAGVSLSPAEPSAAAPFTAASGAVTCVPVLVRQGRAALVSSFALFKYLFSTGLVIMSLALILYTHGCEPLSPHYIIMVVVLGVPAPFVISHVDAHRQLTRRRPPHRLTEPVQVASSLGFVVVQFVGLVAVFIYTSAQPWFLPASVTTKPITTFYTLDKLQPTYEASALFVAMNFVLIMSWLTFSPAAPYRRPVYTNRLLMLLLVAALVISSFVMFYRGSAWSHWLRMLYSPYPAYYLVVATFAVAMGLISYVWETYVIQGYPGMQMSDFLHKLTTKKLPFETIEEELKQKKGWPPLKQSEDIQVEPEPCKIGLEPPGTPDEVAPDQLYARGIIKKPSFRHGGEWRRQAAGDASEPTSPPPVGTFGTFRSSGARPPARLTHRTSIILEETEMRPLSVAPPGEGLTRPPGEELTRPPGEGLTQPPGEELTQPAGEGLTQPPGEELTQPAGEGRLLAQSGRSDA